MANIMHTSQEEIYEVILLAVTILASITGYFIFSIIRQKNSVARWQEARIKAEIDTLENERRRIAGDLHDDIGPLLSAIKLQVDHVEPTDEHERQVLQKSVKQIDEVIKRFRQISYNLLPNTLVRKGLVAAAREFAGKMNDLGSVRIEFASNTELKLSPENEVNLYRIIQEIIHNAIKHSKAEKLCINMYREDDMIILSAEDDGVGFNYEPSREGVTGLGILNIQSRAALLKARLNVDAQTGKGVKYLLSIPAEI